MRGWEGRPARSRPATTKVITATTPRSAAATVNHGGPHDHAAERDPRHATKAFACREGAVFSETRDR